MAVQYNTFLDGSTTLVPGGDDEESVKIDTPDVNTGANASLDYRVTPSGKTTLIIDLNGTELSTVEFNSGTSRVLRENFSGSLLNTTSQNTLKFTVTGDSAANIKLSDGLLLWKDS